jgi:hypothetical protein
VAAITDVLCNAFNPVNSSLAIELFRGHVSQTAVDAIQYTDVAGNMVVLIAAVYIFMSTSASDLGQRMA